MPLDLLFRMPPFRRLYRHAQRDSAMPFHTRALAALGVTVDCSADELTRVPASGALVAVANHPHGMLDGLIAAWTLARVRADIRVLTNRLAAGIPELAQLCFFVDPFAGRHGRRRSQAGLRQARCWLASGGALVVFPAGEVAHRDSAEPTPLDSEWHETAVRLAARMEAPILPLFIAGRNTRLFYRAGRLHPLLRTALLPRELLHQRDRSVAVRIGETISPSNGASPRAGTRIARACVEALRRAQDAASSEPVARPVDPTELERDISQLSAADRLLESGDLQVFCSTAPCLPSVLPEIGRLRELTFRAVGEGTGRTLDLDRFDAWYEHLFVWNRRSREIVGAYRLGAADRILSEHGVTGLYTHTLFDYDQRLMERLPPALELGRSFVREEYQRTSSALLLLWKGIGCYVSRNPRYRALFGPVSISRRYSDNSQRLLRTFLEQNHRHHDLACLVRARNPEMPGTRIEGERPCAVSSVQEADALISALESDGKGMPVLLRQYLRLNASLLGFNVDHAFGDALDALMMVDLAYVDQAILARYFGKREAARLAQSRNPMAAA